MNIYWLCSCIGKMRNKITCKWNISQCRTTVLKINAELKQLLRHLQNEASKQKNQTTIWKRARIAKKPSWDAKNIWGKSQSPFCYMHLALALEPASPEIHWRWANAGGPDGPCSWEVHVASGWVWVWDGSSKTTWMTWDGWKVPTSTSASSTESSWQADRVGHGWGKWKFAQAAVI